MSGVKRTRPDDNSSNQSQTTTDKTSPKTEATSPFVNNIEEEYNW
jgi:hypothetical protein